MTGIDAPYETPEKPFLEIKEGNSLEETVDFIFNAIKNKLQLIFFVADNLQFTLCFNYYKLISTII